MQTKTFQHSRMPCQHCSGTPAGKKCTLLICILDNIAAYQVTGSTSYLHNLSVSAATSGPSTDSAVVIMHTSSPPIRGTVALLMHFYVAVACCSGLPVDACLEVDLVTSQRYVRARDLQLLFKGLITLG